MTVRGPVSPMEVGITACHEHLIADSTSDRSDPDTRLDEPETVLEDLRSFKQAGGDAIVEVTTIDMGRNVERLKELSEASGVRIIASTGFYKGNYSPGGKAGVRSWDFLPQRLRKASVPELSQVFIREVREGVAGTGIWPGVIGEIGTSYNEILEEEERVFRAAARANHETGVPISTHATLGTMGRQQIQILKEEGADLSHVVLSHMDLISDTGYHLELARQGAYLGFDTAGKERYQADATRVELIRRLVQEGFEDQIVISCDIGRRSQMTRHGGRGYGFLLDRYVPRLKAAGIGDVAIRKFLIDNPRRLFAFSAPRPGEDRGGEEKPLRPGATQ
jgi:phosphotriesterase-related protein